MNTIAYMYLVDQLNRRSLNVPVRQQPPMHVRHGLLVAEDIPHSVASQDKEAVLFGQLDGVHFWPRNNLLLVPQLVPFFGGIHLLRTRGSESTHNVKTGPNPKLDRP